MYAFVTEPCIEGVELVCGPPLCPRQTAFLTCTLLRQVYVSWEINSPAGETWQQSLNEAQGKFGQALSLQGLEDFVLFATRINSKTVISNVTFPALLEYDSYAVGCNQNSCKVSIAGEENAFL